MESDEALKELVHILKYSFMFALGDTLDCYLNKILEDEKTTNKFLRKQKVIHDLPMHYIKYIIEKINNNQIEILLKTCAKINSIAPFYTFQCLLEKQTTNNKEKQNIIDSFMIMYKLSC